MSFQPKPKDQVVAMLRRAVLTAGLTLPLGLVSDAARARPPWRGVFVGIGHGDSAADPTFVPFTRALDRTDPTWRRRLRLHHVGAEANDEATLRREIAQVLRLAPDLLVAPTATSARAVAALRTTLPTVFASHTNVVGAGLVASLRSPGGSLAGVSLHDELHDKRLELLRDAYPGVRRVLVLADRFWTHAFDRLGLFVHAAQRLRLVIELRHADDRNELNAVMHHPEAAEADAWYIPPTAIAYFAEREVVSHLATLRRPSIHATVREVERGAPLAYEQDHSFALDAMARLTLRVIAGEDPATIPIERPKRTILAVRADGGSAGAAVAASVVRRADRVF